MSKRPATDVASSYGKEDLDALLKEAKEAKLKSAGQAASHPGAISNAANMQHQSVSTVSNAAQAQGITPIAATPPEDPREDEPQMDLFVTGLHDATIVELRKMADHIGISETGPNEKNGKKTRLQLKLATQPHKAMWGS